MTKRKWTYEPGSVTRELIRLALASGQPVSEALEWDDRTILTVVEWCEETRREGDPCR